MPVWKSNFGPPRLRRQLDGVEVGKLTHWLISTQVLGMWDLIVGPVAGPLRVLVLYLIATINVFRVDVSLFTGNIGWLDPGYNTFASTVMLSERHNNPSCARPRGSYCRRSRTPTLEG